MMLNNIVYPAAEPTVRSGGTLLGNPKMFDILPPHAQHSGLKVTGPYFNDGRRRVDFVLSYRYRQARPPPSAGLDLNNDGRVDAEEGKYGSTDVEETGGDGPPSESSPEDEGEKRRRRDEFEKHLLEAGLHLEKDEEVEPGGCVSEPNVLYSKPQPNNLSPDRWQTKKTHGLGFVRVHVPWHVLLREAEFMKIKMPTKRHRVKLLVKLKVYEVDEERGVMGVLSELWKRVTKKLQPQIPTTGTDNKRHISLPFSRDKQQLFNITDKETFFSSATRSRIAQEILKRTVCSKGQYSMGFSSLIANGVYEAAFPLHDGDCVPDGNKEKNDRVVLYEEWATYGVFYKYQPLDLIRKYFGEKIGLYFAWLGIYTELLIPASIVGIIVFLYGCATVHENIPSNEFCDHVKDFVMCPLCDKTCGYWNLSTTCSTARASHLFDNPATVFFSVFMALWATTFLERWKRQQMRLTYLWDLTGMDDEEGEPRPEYETKLIEKKQKRKKKEKQKKDQTKNEQAGKKAGLRRWKETVQSATAGVNLVEEEELTWRDRLSSCIINLSSIIFMVALTFAIVFALIVYRVSVAAALSVSPDPSLRFNNRFIVTSTAVLINLILILILDEIYGFVAHWLTVVEVPKTEQEFEERFIFKSFMLKFVNAYTTIFYVAFLKGRITGRPGRYLYIFGQTRMEECAPGGCLIELCIQLSFIMLGKQLIQNNIFEIGIPKLKKLCRSIKASDKRSGRAATSVAQGNKVQQMCWERDHELEPFAGLTPEYMEMIIQFGFVTLFVASFPLAPIFALLNNIIEIRLDGKKFVSELRRPTAMQSKDIGIWYNILHGVGKLAVIINAFVIAMTSDFIPRLAYQYVYSPNGTLHGFVEHTLSSFNTSDFPEESVNNAMDALKVSMCHFRDYREPPWSLEKYELSKQYWTVMAIRLMFVLIFQNLVMFSSSMLDWLIPDVPEDIAESIRKEQRLAADCFLRDEQEKHNILQTFATQKQDQKEQLTPPFGPHQAGGNDSPILRESGGTGNPVTLMMEAEDISPENNSNDGNNLFTNDIKL